jgi:hypothetical protein
MVTLENIVLWPRDDHFMYIQNGQTTYNKLYKLQAQIDNHYLDDLFEII